MDLDDKCPECGGELTSGFDCSDWEFTNGGSVLNEDWDESPMVYECGKCELAWNEDGSEYDDDDPFFESDFY